MPPRLEVDESKVRNDLKQIIDDAGRGGQVSFASKARVAVSDVNHTYHGRRPPSLAILHALGYRRVVRYVKRVK